MQGNIILKIGPVAIQVKTMLHSPMYSYIKQFCKKHLVEHSYDRVNRIVVQGKAYAWYNNKSSEWHIPIGFLKGLKGYLHIEAPNIEVIEETIDCYGNDNLIDLSMKEGFTPRDHQIKAVEYLCDDTVNRKGLSLYTGCGKTYTAIYAMVHFKRPGMIVVSGLIEQWIDSLLQFTTLTREDIYVFQLSKRIYDLLQSDFKPKVIVASLETIREYLKAEKLDEVPMSWEHILLKYNIGTKIYDEVHLRFHAYLQMDLRCNNIDQHFYLTATFKVNNASTNKIFNTVYPEDMLYIKDREKFHIETTMYAYYLDMPPGTAITKYGYNHAKYEKAILRRVRKYKQWETTLLSLFNAHFINKKNKGEKCLIYFRTLVMIDKILPRFIELYPKLKIDKYTGNDKDTKFDNDVLLSTVSKCAEAKDIPRLRTVINSVSIQAETKIIQMFGRLRPLDNDISGEYIHFFNATLPVHVRMYRAQKKTLQYRSKSYVELVM